VIQYSETSAIEREAAARRPRSSRGPAVEAFYFAWVVFAFFVGGPAVGGRAASGAPDRWRFALAANRFNLTHHALVCACTFTTSPILPPPPSRSVPRDNDGCRGTRKIISSAGIDRRRCDIERTGVAKWRRDRRRIASQRADPHLQESHAARGVPAASGRTLMAPPPNSTSRKRWRTSQHLGAEQP